MAPELQQFFSDTHKRPATLPPATLQQQQGLGRGTSTSRRFATTLTNTLGAGPAGTGVTLGVTSGTTMRLDGTGTKRRPPALPPGLPAATLWRPREALGSGAEAGAAAGDDSGVGDVVWAASAEAGEQHGAAGDASSLTCPGAGGAVGEAGRLMSSLEASLDVLSSSSPPSSRQQAASSSIATAGEGGARSPPGSTPTTSRAQPAGAGATAGAGGGGGGGEGQGTTGSRTAAAALTGSMSPGELPAGLHTCGSCGGMCCGPVQRHGVHARCHMPTLCPLSQGLLPVRIQPCIQPHACPHLHTPASVPPQHLAAEPLSTTPHHTT